MQNLQRKFSVNLCKSNCPSFQFRNGDAGFTFTIGTQSETLDAFMFFKMVLNSFPQYAGSFAVDNRDLVNARQDAGVDKAVDFDQCFLDVHTAQVNLSQAAASADRTAASGDTGGPDAAGTFAGRFALNRDFGLIQQPEVADRDTG